MTFRKTENIQVTSTTPRNQINHRQMEPILFSATNYKITNPIKGINLLFLHLGLNQGPSSEPADTIGCHQTTCEIEHGVVMQ